MVRVIGIIVSSQQILRPVLLIRQQNITTCNISCTCTSVVNIRCCKKIVVHNIYIHDMVLKTRF